MTEPMTPWQREQQRQADEHLQSRIERRQANEQRRAEEHAARNDEVFWHYPEGWGDSPY